MQCKASFVQASVAQISGSPQCTICLESLLSKDVSKSDKQAQLSTKVVYLNDCTLPHMIHRDCAMRLLELAPENEASCPVCRRRIYKTEENLSFFRSLVKREENEEKFSEYEQELGESLIEQRSLPEYAISLQLKQRIAKVMSLSSRSNSLNEALVEARWLMGSIHLHRAKKYLQEQDLDEAADAFSFCEKQDLGGTGDKLQEVQAARLNAVLTSVRKVPALAESRLSLFTKERGVLPGDRETTVKLAELNFIAGHYRYQSRSTNVVLSLGQMLTAFADGYECEGLMLADLCLKELKKALCPDRFAHLIPLNFLLRWFEFSSTHGSDQCQQKAGLLKNALPTELLACAVQCLSTTQISNTQISVAREYLEHVIDNGSESVRRKAIRELAELLPTDPKYRSGEKQP